MRSYRVENYKNDQLYDKQEFKTEKEAKKYLKLLIGFYQANDVMVKTGYSEMYSINYVMDNSDVIKYVDEVVE